MLVRCTLLCRARAKGWVPAGQPMALLLAALGVLMVCALGWQVKPHLFTHTKHRIAQLNTLLSQRQQ